MKYVDVIIDNQNNNTDQFYTYECELEDIAPGDKVLVPFANGNKSRDAYVFEVKDQPDPRWKTLKKVTDRDPLASLPQDVIPLCGFMRDRYFCRYIEALKCFAPSGTPSKKGKLRVPEKGGESERIPAPNLTEEQSAGLATILPVVKRREHQVFLIHGVTSSGKTELYLRTIQETVEQGRNAILLVPEIALTAQTIERLVNRFGPDQVAVLHSKLSLGERHDEWMRVKRGDVKIVIGARSAVFAPFTNIGALIIDEEHETSYKSDMSPKYDTIEVAIQRGMLNQAVVLLGSATPSLVTTYRAEQGIYQKILLLERYNKNQMPEVEVVDMRNELKQGNRSMFSSALYHDIRNTLDQKQQVILFLNRRGYATFLSCRSCGFVLRCKECGISLTYHKESDRAVCHFCGHQERIPKTCPSCQGSYFKHFGVGTEKVEEHTREVFPEQTVARLDLDTTKQKGSIERILNDFRRRRTDILIGTQLVAKGLDFAHVGLVGILAADLSLHIPDFRSPERTFQLITQASGRTGRGDQRGKVLIQSYTPDHYAIITAASNDYQNFYQQELFMRQQVQYPPYSDLVQVVISAEDEAAAKNEIQETADAFIRMAGETARSFLLGPKPAPMSKINGYYRYQLLIKCVEGHREAFLEVLWEIKRQRVGKKTQTLFSVDINPYSFV